MFGCCGGKSVKTEDTIEFMEGNQKHKKQNSYVLPPEKDKELTKEELAYEQARYKAAQEEADDLFAPAQYDGETAQQEVNKASIQPKLLEDQYGKKAQKLAQSHALKPLKAVQPKIIQQEEEEAKQKRPKARNPFQLRPQKEEFNYNRPGSDFAPAAGKQFSDSDEELKQLVKSRRPQKLVIYKEIDQDTLAQNNQRMEVKNELQMITGDQNVDEDTLEMMLKDKQDKQVQQQTVLKFDGKELKTKLMNKVSVKDSTRLQNEDMLSPVEIAKIQAEQKEYRKDLGLPEEAPKEAVKEVDKDEKSNSFRRESPSENEKKLNVPKKPLGTLGGKVSTGLLQPVVARKGAKAKAKLGGLKADFSRGDLSSRATTEMETEVEVVQNERPVTKNEETAEIIKEKFERIEDGNGSEAPNVNHKAEINNVDVEPFMEGVEDQGKDENNTADRITQDLGEEIMDSDLKTIERNALPGVTSWMQKFANTERQVKEEKFEKTKVEDSMNNPEDLVKLIKQKQSAAEEEFSLLAGGKNKQIDFNRLRVLLGVQNEEQFLKFCQAIDADESGTVGWDEYNRLLIALDLAADENKFWIAVFVLADKNVSGTLELDELNPVMIALDMTEAEQAKLREFIGSFGSVGCTLQQFVKWVKVQKFENLEKQAAIPGVSSWMQKFATSERRVKQESKEKKDETPEDLAKLIKRKQSAAVDEFSLLAGGKDNQIEFKRLRVLLGVQNEEQFLQFCAAIGVEKSETVGWDEYNRLLIALDQAAGADKMWIAVFVLADKNVSGTLELDELDPVMAALELPEDQRVQLREFIGNFGSVGCTLEEFVDWMSKLTENKKPDQESSEGLIKLIKARQSAAVEEFSELAGGKSGQIEFRRLRELLEVQNEEQFLRFCEAIDADQSGTVGWTEYNRLLVALDLAAQTGKFWIAVFVLADRNVSGTLELAALNQVMEALELPEDEKAQLREFVDGFGSVGCTLEEFVPWVSAFQK